jgi:hypothetical protein
MASALPPMRLSDHGVDAVVGHGTSLHASADTSLTTRDRGCSKCQRTRHGAPHDVCASEPARIDRRGRHR